jgi:hypothetical protein
MRFPDEIHDCTEYCQGFNDALKEVREMNPVDHLLIEQTRSATFLMRLTNIYGLLTSAGEWKLSNGSTVVFKDLDAKTANGVLNDLSRQIRAIEPVMLRQEWEMAVRLFTTDRFGAWIPTTEPSAAQLADQSIMKFRRVWVEQDGK